MTVQELIKQLERFPKHTMLLVEGKSHQIEELGKRAFYPVTGAITLIEREDGTAASVQLLIGHAPIPL